VDGLFSAPKRMKTAFVGSSALAWQLLQEASRASDQPLPPSVLQGPLRERALAAGIPLRLAASAEDVMLDPANQVVVLALEDCDEILRLTRAAVQAEKHVVVVLPELTASPALTFELQLVWTNRRRPSSRCWGDGNCRNCHRIALCWVLIRTRSAS